MNYLIYGAYGFTGELIARRAKSLGHHVILAGRDETKLAALANELDYPYAAFDLESIELGNTLKKVDAVLNCAGPYSKTIQPVLNACFEHKKHYVDITGEIGAFEYAFTRRQEAETAGITVLPGAGFDVVPTDCLAGYLKHKMPTATHLEMGFQSLSSLSRGTALTMTENLDKGGVIRENGKLRNVQNAYRVRKWDRKGKSLSFVSIPWGDVSTSYHTTGIPNIIVYTALPPKVIARMKRINPFKKVLGLSFVQKYLQKRVRKSVKGPTAEQMETVRSYIWGEVRDTQGNIFRAEMETMEGYKLTAFTAVEIMDRILNGKAPSGFQTPFGAFGMSLLKKLPETTIEDLV